MSFKVLKRFLDVETKKLYEVGDEYPSDTDTQRLRSLQAKTSQVRHESLQGSPLIEEIKEDIEDDESVKEEPVKEE